MACSSGFSYPLASARDGDRAGRRQERSHAEHSHGATRRGEATEGPHITSRVRGAGAGGGLSGGRGHGRLGRRPRGLHPLFPDHAGRQRHGVRRDPASGSHPRELDRRALGQAHEDARAAGGRRHDRRERPRLRDPSEPGPRHRPGDPAAHTAARATGDAHADRLFLPDAGRGPAGTSHRHRSLRQRHRRHPRPERDPDGRRYGPRPGPHDRPTRWHAEERDRRRRGRPRAAGGTDAGDAAEVHAASLRRRGAASAGRREGRRGRRDRGPGPPPCPATLRLQRLQARHARPTHPPSNGAPARRALAGLSSAPAKRPRRAQGPVQ